MINDKKYSCMNELSAEILMLITSFIIHLLLAGILMIKEKNLNLILSSVYTLFLPPMTYLFSQTKQHYPDGRAQVILYWMVSMEIIRISGTPVYAWELLKSAEQLVRLLWVAFLVYSYATNQWIRHCLFILCLYFSFHEIRKGIIFYNAKHSYLFGKNPELIHNYVKSVLLQPNLPTTPMNECSYIVMGEENHNPQIFRYGYLLGKKNSNSKGILTIRRVYQLNSSEDTELSLAYPKWRDTCLSLALAKMLRRRFAKLPVDEAGHKKALDFVVESLINHTCSDQYIQRDGTDGEKNRTERVFNIIQTELQIVYDFLHIKVTSFEYFEGYTYNFLWTVGIAMLPIFVIRIKNELLFLVEHEAYRHCVFHVSGLDYDGRAIFMFLDALITFNLGRSWLYIVLVWDGLKGQHKNCWDTIKAVNAFFKDPAKWKSNYNSLKASWSRNLRDYIFERLRKLCWFLSGEGVKEAGIYSSVLDLEAETILYCIKVDGSTLARLPKWIRRIIRRSPPTVVHSTDAKQAIIDSFKRSVAPINQAVEKFDQESVLTNGGTTLQKYGMQHLNWACTPNSCTTVSILIWHIATTLFHHQQNNDSPQETAPQQNDPRQEAATQENNNSRHEPTPQQNNQPHQEPAAQQNNDPFREEEVALSLSSYCHYLVKYLPELLPDAVDWTEDKYEFVTKDIIEIALFFYQKPTKKDRCDYALMAMWDQSSLFGLGVRLAKELMNCSEQGRQVWKMLAEFWAEMILFVAPSDNVEGHQQILEREELITQLWAVLTHAGIVTRREHTLIPTDPIESNVSNAVENV